MALPDYNLKFYFSGSMGRADEHEYAVAKEMECRLCSCHGDYMAAAERWVEISNDKSTGITKYLADSGAFTSWSKGHKVDISQLIKTYHRIVDKLDTSKVQPYLINLDVIPGSKGKTAGTEEIEAAIKESDVNFNILNKEFGDIVIPVYHQNESEARLAEVDAMADYICVSPRNDLPEWTRVKWSEEVHSKLPPGKRTHGLATTGANMMNRVPWYSVDSAAWLYSGAMGKVDCWHGGKWVSINISKESPDRYNERKHYDNADKLVRQVIEERAAFHNIEVSKLRDDHMARKLLNGLEIIEFLKEFKFEPKLMQDGLFDL